MSSKPSWRIVRKFLREVACLRGNAASEPQLLARAGDKSLPAWQRMGWLLSSLFRHVNNGPFSRLFEPEYAKFFRGGHFEPVPWFTTGPEHLFQFTGTGTQIIYFSPRRLGEWWIYLQTDYGNQVLADQEGFDLLDALMKNDAKIIEMECQMDFEIKASKIHMRWHSMNLYPILVQPSEALPFRIPQYRPRLRYSDPRLSFEFWHDKWESQTGKQPKP